MGSNKSPNLTKSSFPSSKNQLHFVGGLTKLQRLKQARLSGNVLSREELYQEFIDPKSLEGNYSNSKESQKAFNKMLHKAHNFHKPSSFSRLGTSNFSSKPQHQAFFQFNFHTYKFEKSSVFSNIHCPKNDKLIIALLKKDIENNVNLNLSKNGI